MKDKTEQRKNENSQGESVCRSLRESYERISTALFIVSLVTVGLCLVFIERPVFSESEKRELAKKPVLTYKSYLDGSFSAEFSKYFSDTVPFRELLVSLCAEYNRMKGIGSAPKFYGEVTAVEDNNNGDVPPNVTVSEENGVKIYTVFTNNGIIVDGIKMYGGNAGVMLFKEDKALGTRYAEIISRYKAAMGEDVNVYNLVVPTAVEFYLHEKFSGYSSSEKDAIDHIYNSYTEDVVAVDVYSELAAHTDEYIYLRTDHHWSHRGAYYAYSALAKAMGAVPKDIDKDYEAITLEGYVGSLYAYTNDVTLKNSPESFTYYKPKTPYKAFYYDNKTLELQSEGSLFNDEVDPRSAYGVFLCSDFVHTKIVTENSTGRKVCVFKESYGNAFAPYLVDLFDEIYVIDIRYFGRNAVDYMKEKGITDVVFLNNAFAVTTSNLVGCIEERYSMADSEYESDTSE